MEQNYSIMGAVGLFIAVAILLSISITILDSAVGDCSALPDYDPTATTQTGWAGSCEDSNAGVQSAFSLLVIILIVVSATVILFIVRLL